MRKSGLALLAVSVTWLLLCVASADFASAETAARPVFPFRNLDSVIRQLNLPSYFQSRSPARTLKVAVFDNGFLDFQREIGVSLPADTHHHPGPIAVPQPEEKHGLVMAQLLYAIMSGQGSALQFTPELHLYNTFGYSNLKAAVEDAIARQVDVILYAQVWEYGGNHDGRGFINSLVTSATRSGILWVNAAGNFGDTTYNSPVTVARDQWVDLPGPNESVEIRCEENARKSCALRLVLSWNDFKDDTSLGTDKDLDLVLTDDLLNIIQTSALVQTTSNEERPGTSKYPREIIQAQLKPGLYFARIKDRSSNFTSSDRLRLTASGAFITIPVHASRDETLLNPADHPDVIAVGATDSEKSSSSARLQKPELFLPSQIILASGEEYRGSSNSAAIAAGALAVLKSIHPEWNRTTLLAQVRSLPVRGQGLPLSLLGFGPTNALGCFEPRDPAQVALPGYVTQALDLGGKLVQTTAGMKVFFEVDPIQYMPGVRRTQPNDILLVGPAGTGLLPRGMVWQLPPYLMEVLQTPAGQSICGSFRPGNGFRLP